MDDRQRKLRLGRLLLLLLLLLHNRDNLLFDGRWGKVLLHALRGQEGHGRQGLGLTENAERLAQPLDHLRKIGSVEGHRLAAARTAPDSNLNCFRPGRGSYPAIDGAVRAVANQRRCTAWLTE